MHICTNCNIPTTNPKFCTKSCAAKYNNKAKGPRTAETKLKIAQTKTIQFCKVKQCKHCLRFQRPSTNCIYCNQLCNRKKRYTPIIDSAIGCVLNRCICKTCDLHFVAKEAMRYCNDHRNSGPKNARMNYRFKFNVYDYPELFDLELIAKFGWYSPGGKAGTMNINGISRDHRISIADAIKHHYDSYYITHPLNCELMQHEQNNKKKGNSSITYADLVASIILFDFAGK